MPADMGPRCADTKTEQTNKDVNYSTTCLKRPFTNRQNKDLNDMVA